MTLTSHLCVSDASHLHLMHPYFIQPVLYLHNRSAAVSNHTVWPELQKQQYVQGACAAVVVILDLYPLPFFLPSLPPSLRTALKTQPWPAALGLEMTVDRSSAGAGPRPLC